MTSSLFRDPTVGQSAMPKASQMGGEYDSSFETIINGDGRRALAIRSREHLPLPPNLAEWVAQDFRIGVAAKVFSNSHGSWHRGRIASQDEVGRLVVEFEVDGCHCRKALAPDSPLLRLVSAEAKATTSASHKDGRKGNVDTESSVAKPATLQSINSVAVVEVGQQLKMADDWDLTLTSLVSSGGFTKVFRARDSSKAHFILKTASDSSLCLDFEARVYKALFCSPCVCRCIFYDVFPDHSELLLLEDMGPDLATLAKEYTFDLQTTMLAADQMLRCLEAVHVAGFLHNDVKPSCFRIGAQPRGASHLLFIGDFGLATCMKRVTEQLSSQQRTLNSSSLFGTPLFASRNAILGQERCARDDLESLWVSLVWLFRGELPWDNDWDSVRQKREYVHPEKLIPGLPKEFILFFEYVDLLKDGSEPSYEFLRTVCTAAIDREHSSRLFFPWP